MVQIDYTMSLDQWSEWYDDHQGCVIIIVLWAAIELQHVQFSGGLLSNK